MKLVELDARFLRHEREMVPKDEWVTRGSFRFKTPTGIHDTFIPVAKMFEAHGVSFLCPKDFAKNGGAKGTHSVYIWFAGSPVPPEIGTNKEGKTVRWNASGTGLGDLTLTPSIQEQDGEGPHACNWHGFVTNGDAA